MSQAWAEKNRHAEWNDNSAAIPAPASMPTTVRRRVRATSPVANTTNNPNVDDRRNTGRSVCNRSSQLVGRVDA